MDLKIVFMRYSLSVGSPGVEEPPARQSWRREQLAMPGSQAWIAAAGDVAGLAVRAITLEGSGH
jgi:hypothetical protein